MRRFQHRADVPLYSIFTLCSLLMIASSSGFAQRTVVQDAGAGKKLELHYNAAGQIVETRTLGPNGELLQKHVLEYSPAAYIPQTTTTYYWPSGKIHRVTQNTYDNNANFTGEFIQVFDETGKQVSGHRLTRDPQTGVYRCNEWDEVAQDYKPRECPAGEESAGTPEAVKTFTRDEVIRQLDRARQGKQKDSLSPTPSAQPITSTTMKEVGLVLPAEIHPGERISGSVVEDPAKYEGIPGVTVTRVTLPFQPPSNPSSLQGWTLEMSGEPPQAADGPISLSLAPGQVELAVMFRQAGNPGAPVSKAIPVTLSPRRKSKTSEKYLAPAICVKGQLCVVHGAFSGDSSKTFAAVEDRAAKIVAETSDTVFVAIPDRTEAGTRPLAIAEGSKAIVFPTIVAALNIRPDRRDLAKGDLLLMYATLAGPEELPDAEWRAGNYPSSNLAEAQKLVPGFEASSGNAHEKREAEEKRETAEKREAKEKHAGENGEHDEAEGGQILLVINNLTPGQASFHQSKNGSYVFHLNDDSFKMGDFTYKFVVEGTAAGNFNLQAHAIPLLAPVTGQEFAMTPASGK